MADFVADFADVPSNRTSAVNRCCLGLTGCGDCEETIRAATALESHRSASPRLELSTRLQRPSAAEKSLPFSGFPCLPRIIVTAPDGEGGERSSSSSHERASPMFWQEAGESAATSAANSYHSAAETALFSQLK